MLSTATTATADGVISSLFDTIVDCTSIGHLPLTEQQFIVDSLGEIMYSRWLARILGALHPHEADTLMTCVRDNDIHRLNTLISERVPDAHRLIRDEMEATLRDYAALLAHE